MPIRFVDDLESGTGSPIVPQSIVKAPTGATEDNADDYLKNLAGSLLAWNFDATTTDATDPGTSNVAINNAAKASATILTFNTSSAVDAARFDEFLGTLGSDDRVFLQQRTATGNGILYRLTGAASTSGTRVNLPVTSERTLGSEFTDNATLNVSFFSRGISAIQALFLAEITQTGGVFGFTANVKIDRDNVEANYRAVIEAGGTPVDISALTSKVNALFPLTPDVSILTDWATIYDPAHGSENVAIVDGYTSLVDFRATDNRYEAAGITYTAGFGVSDYAGLSDSVHRSFGLSGGAAANQTLVSITDGMTQIPFIDMTAAGNFRVNDFTPARAQDEVVTNHLEFASLDAGSVGNGTISQGGAASTYLVPDYPANTTSQTRGLVVEFEVLVNGADQNAAGFVTVDGFPDTDIASTNDVDHTFFTGWPLNRSITATFRFATRIPASDLLLDITLQSAPSDVTFRINSVEIAQNYTASVVIARVDNYITLQDAGGDFTFSNPSELLIEFETIPGGTAIEAVPVVRDNTTGTVAQLNNITLKPPSPGFDELQVPDTIEFRTFLADHYLSHSELAHLVGRRGTKWVYGLARLNTVTGRAVTQPMDLATGTTLNSAAISTNLAPVEVYQATGTGSGPGELVNLVSLPANYTNYDFVHITERNPGPPIEWRHTVITTHLLNSGDVGASDLLRLQGNTDLTWTAGSRTITVSDSAQEIYRVVLVDT